MSKEITEAEFIAMLANARSACVRLRDPLKFAACFDLLCAATDVVAYGTDLMYGTRWDEIRKLALELNARYAVQLGFEGAPHVADKANQ